MKRFGNIFQGFFKWEMHFAEMTSQSQERAKRHSGYGEDRSDLYGSYDSYGYSSGGYSSSCGCCQNQDTLLPLILAGIAAAAGYFFGRDNNNNGRSLETRSVRSAEVILQGQSSHNWELSIDWVILAGIQEFAEKMEKIKSEQSPDALWWAPFKRIWLSIMTFFLKENL